MGLCDAKFLTNMNMVIGNDNATLNEASRVLVIFGIENLVSTNIYVVVRVGLVCGTKWICQFYLPSIYLNSTELKLTA